MDRDLLNSISTRRAANCTMEVLDRIQHQKTHEQVASVTATFVLLCEHLKIQPQDVFTTVDNIMNHAEGRRPEFAAQFGYRSAL